jgi:tetratricopeptide (TPR) repeat protein
MKTLPLILSVFFFSNSIPAFSGMGNPAQEGTAIPVFYAPENPVQEETEIQSGSKFDFGDYSSSTLVQKAWASLAANDLKAVEAYANEAIELYAGTAKKMQRGLKDYASGGSEQIFKYWALNDVGTALFILGEAYRHAGQKEEAIEAFNKVVNEYYFSQCWDPRGWFWKPAEGAQQRLTDLVSS